MSTRTTITTLILASAILYTIIWSIGCSPMAVYTHETFERVGIESQIALADVDGKESFGHTYVIVNDHPIEPRYLGLYLQGNIDYDNPYAVYDSTSDYMEAGHTVFPEVYTIVNAMMEV